MDYLDHITPQSDFRAGAMLLVDKPAGWTSFDVVNKVRWALRKRLNVKKIKVGHSGTLDPMATGLLLLCTGKWTKRLAELQGLDKAYEGTIRFGATTPSYDGETDIDRTWTTDGLTCEGIARSMRDFEGDIMQRPPIFSAIKVDGRPLYRSARQGKEVNIEPRPVRIDAITMTRCELPDVDFTVRCSKGTYIRSLAYDLGQACDNGAYLTRLVRTAVGDYQLKEAWELGELIGQIQGATQNIVH